MKEIISRNGIPMTSQYSASYFTLEINEFRCYEVKIEKVKRSPVTEWYPNCIIYVLMSKPKTPMELLIGWRGDEVGKNLVLVGRWTRQDI